MGEAEDSAQVREVSGGAIWDGTGHQARRLSIENCFYYSGRRIGNGCVGRGIQATGGSPQLGLRGGGK